MGVRSDCLGQNILERLPLLVVRASRALSGSQAEEKLFPRVAVPAGYPRCRTPASERRIPGRRGWAELRRGLWHEHVGDGREHPAWVGKLAAEGAGL